MKKGHIQICKQLAHRDYSLSNTKLYLINTKLNAEAFSLHVEEGHCASLREQLQL